MQMVYETLKLKVTENLLIVTLNRPEVRNAINFQMMQELKQLWSDLYIDINGIRCVILTGAGDKAFCAGADLKERNNLDVKTWLMQHAVLEQAMLAMVDCPVPVIAAVNGPAFGGGLELILGSDFVYAVDTATFAFPEGKLGIIPGAMGTQNLPVACGLARAKEICFTGGAFNAEEAKAWGVVNKICSAENLLSEVLKTANVIINNAPLAITQLKKSLNATRANLITGYQFEIEAYKKLLPTDDRMEGISAFNEKRKPNFKGC